MSSVLYLCQKYYLDNYRSSSSTIFSYTYIVTIIAQINLIIVRILVSFGPVKGKLYVSRTSKYWIIHIFMCF